MSLYKQKNSEIWWLDITVSGQPRLREPTGQLDRRKAQIIHDERKVELRKIAPRLSGKTWGDAVHKWLDVETRSDSELLSLAKFTRFFADRQLDAVTAEDIDEALSFCRTAGTYTRYRTMIAAILNLSKIKLDLASRRDKKKKPRDWITPAQWAKLYAELPAHLKPMAAFAVASGLRQANVLGLSWARVDLARKAAWVEGEDAKAGQAINVPLSDEAIHVLNTVKARAADNAEFVFTFRGKPVKDIKTAFIAACIRAGVGQYVVHEQSRRYVGFTWHGLRHTFATWHVQNGTPLEVLKDLGGWADLRSVLVYAHHAPNRLASYANNSRSQP